MARKYRLFLSSPGDVARERGIVEEVVRRVNDDAGADGFELYRWEAEHYSAAGTFQDQIPHASESDLVVCIFWKRLGSELPDDFARPDGSIPTGSEYEFEQAIAQATASDDQLPDIYVYRSEEEVTFSAKTLELEKLQFDKLEAFWKRWFRNERGHFTAAFDTYADDAAFEDKIERALRDWLDKRKGAAVWTDGSPFRGLQPFESVHAPIFFGRRRETARARARLMVLALAGVRFMLICGPSGSGKSSLARAGVIPALAAPGAGEVLPDQRLHLVTSPNQLRPDGGDADWARSLADVVFADAPLADAMAGGDFTDAVALADLFRAGGPAVSSVITAALTRVGDGLVPQRPVGLVLLLDQLEEIFGWPVSEADAFCALLAGLAQAAPGEPGVTVIATMRSEFRHRLADIPALAALVQFDAVPGPDDPDPVLDITLPAPADIRDMIEGPARAAGLTYASAEGELPALSARIEAEAAPAALPALQYLLTQLYPRRDGPILTHEAFDALGGVAGVMAHQGEEIIATKGATHLPQLVRALVKGGTPPTARRVAKTVFDGDTGMADLVQAFVDAGLIVADDTTLRLAHESLITGWDRLNGIVRDEARLFENRDRLAGLTPQFVSGEIPALDGFLLNAATELQASWGEDLVAEAHPKLPAFIAASIKADKAKRMRRVAGWTGLAAAAVAGAIGFGLLQASQRAQTAALLTESEKRNAVASSESATRDGNAVAALDHAITAYEWVNDDTTLSLMMEKSLLLASPEVAWTRAGDYTAVAWADDFELIGAKKDGTIVSASAEGERLLASLAPVLGDVFVRQLVALPGGGIGFMTRNNRIGVIPDGVALGDAKDIQMLPHNEVLVFDRTAQFMAPMHDGFVVVAPKRLARTLAVTYCPTVANAGCSRIDHALSAPGYTLTAIQDSIVLLDNGRFQTFTVDPQTGPTVDAIDHSNFVFNGGFDTVHDTQMDANGKTVMVARAVPETPLENLLFLHRIDFATGDRLPVIDVDQRYTFGDAPGRVSFAAIPGANADVAFSAAEGVMQVISRAPGNAETSLAQIRHPARNIQQITVAPNGQMIAILGFDGAVTVATRAGAPAQTRAITRIETGVRDVTGFAATADGEFVNFGSFQMNHFGEIIRHNHAFFFHTAIAPDGRVASVDANGDLLLWDRSAPQDRNVIANAGDAGARLRFAGNGSLVFSALRRLQSVSDSGAVGLISPTPPDNLIFGGVTADPNNPDLIYVSDSRGGLHQWITNTDQLTPAVPLAQSADRNAGLSLSIDPTGRWLTSTRSDQQIRVYDLTGALDPVVLPIDTSDSKVVDFSPDGRYLAALASAGDIYVWSFDIETGEAARIYAIAPETLPDPVALNPGRIVIWIDWMGPEHIGVATSIGDVLKLSVDPDDWYDRAQFVMPRAGGFLR